MHEAEVENCPLVFSHRITDLPTDIVGKDLKIKMSATNVADLTYVSNKVFIVRVSDLPGQPAQGP